MPGSNHVGAIGSDTWPGIAKLNEECGEAVQVCGKIFAFPQLTRREAHPDGESVHTRLECEIGDLLAAIEYTIKSNNLDAVFIRDRRDRKLKRFWRWDRQERERRAA